MTGGAVAVVLAGAADDGVRVLVPAGAGQAALLAGAVAVVDAGVALVEADTVLAGAALTLVVARAALARHADAVRAVTFL